jgi:hypothetical protein
LTQQIKVFEFPHLRAKSTRQHQIQYGISTNGWEEALPVGIGLVYLPKSVQQTSTFWLSRFVVSVEKT